MVGKQVIVTLTNTFIRGELRKIDAAGVYLYVRQGLQDGVIFYPMHTVIKIEEC